MVRSEHYTFRLIIGESGEVRGTGLNNAERPEQEGEPNPNHPIAPKNGVKNTVAGAAALYMGKQAVSYATSRVETFTGSSRAQDTVSTAMKTIGYAGAIIANPTLGLAALAVEGITSMLDYSFRMKWENKRTDQMRARAGFTTEGLRV